MIVKEMKEQKNNFKSKKVKATEAAKFLKKFAKKRKK